ncbi:MAG: hypothetical protein PHR14_09340 [Oscillospiraceae bacterium]|nr:hypothetical protein [Oscillospiraceae bacterium]
MLNKEENKICFPQQSNYHIGAVTYQVAAFYNEDGNTLKTKINRLLTDEIKKSNCTFAAEPKSVI